MLISFQRITIAVFLAVIGIIILGFVLIFSVHMYFISDHFSKNVSDEASLICGEGSKATSFAEDDKSYRNVCTPDQTSVIVQMRTWMLLPGQLVRVCITTLEDGTKQADRPDIVKN